jgi:hypothetical protein
MPKFLTPLRLFILFACVILTNSILWLDSLDNYFNNREHVQISNTLPHWLFSPSQRIHLQEKLVSLTVEDKASQTQIIEEAKVPIIQFNHTSLEQTPKVLFAGDSLMQGVAPIAIAELKKIYPQGKFVDLSQQSTGLTVRRYFDWPKKIAEESMRQGFNTVVIFLGANDPWDIYDNKKRFIFPSDEWKEAYRERVGEVLLFAQEHQIHIIWVGLPNMDVERVKNGAILQNSVFESETKKYNFEFISTEAILGSLDEPYKKYLQDPTRGSILIRGNDGVHFTPYGYRLVSNQIVQSLKEKF